MKLYTAREISEKNNFVFSHVVAMIQKINFELGWYPAKQGEKGKGGKYNKKQVDYIIKRIKMAKEEGEKAKIRESESLENKMLIKFKNGSIFKII